MKHCLFILLSLLTIPFAQAADKLSVITSIKPLQLITQAVVADLGEVRVLLPDGGSPHHYALRPSDIRTMSKADLIVWVGPELEAFLNKPLQQTNVPVLQLLEDGSAEKNEDSHEHEHEHEQKHDHHQHGSQDPHIWLEPELALLAAKRIQEMLAKDHPSLSPQLLANYEKFATELQEKDRVIAQQLKPLQAVGFVVFHDAFGRFVEHYGLHQVAAFTLDPAYAPGIKTVNKIRQLIKQKKAHCVFAEPQFKTELLQRVVEGTGVRLGMLDPLAVSLKDGAGYTDYLQSLSNSIQECLSE